MTTRRAKLTGEELEHLRCQLLMKEQWLQRGACEDAALAALEEDHGDDCDQASHAGAQEWALSSLRREAQELQRIEEALRRMESGEYGTCSDCGSEIALNRLRALPCAALCLECQERAEARSPTEGIYSIE